VTASFRTFALNGKEAAFCPGAFGEFSLHLQSV